MVKVSYTSIAIKEGTVLSRGDGNILCYSKKGGYYYSVELSNILAAYDEKYKNLEKKMTNYVSAMDNKQAEMTKSYNEMVKTMKDTMNSMISMVETSSTSK